MKAFLQTTGPLTTSTYKPPLFKKDFLDASKYNKQNAFGEPIAFKEEDLNQKLPEQVGYIN